MPLYSHLLVVLCSLQLFPTRVQIDAHDLTSDRKPTGGKIPLSPILRQGSLHKDLEQGP